MTTEITIIDHTTNAIDKFLAEYQNADDFKSLVNLFLEEIDDIETEVDLFLTMRSIASAEGVNLNRWGDILEATFRPIDDDNFRALLYGLIAAYNGEATVQSIKDIVTNLVEPKSAITVYDYFNATFEVSVVGWTSFIGIDQIASIIGFAKPVGIEFGGLISIPDAFTPFFAFEGDFDPNADGFSSIGGTDGGYYGIKL